MATENALINGPDGPIDLIIDTPDHVRGIALVCHPHPLFHGANTNKVAHTLARVFRDLGYAALRPNFRGVGKSEGTHDHGVAETDDMLAAVRALAPGGPLALARLRLRCSWALMKRAVDPSWGRWSWLRWP